MAIPIGSVMNYTAYTLPGQPSTGEVWFLCDGSTPRKDKTEYVGLFSVIQDAFGPSNAMTTFALPDLRGYFVRATDSTPKMHAARRDPDVDSRVTMAPENEKNAVGSTQQSAVGQHGHDLTNTWGASDYWVENSSLFKDTIYGCSTPPSGTTRSNGTKESRPKNIGLSFIILAQNPTQRLFPGAIVAYAGSDDPQDDNADGDAWRICDGQSLSRSDYPAFFKQFADVLGCGDGSATFQLPDFRGYFLRGRCDEQTPDDGRDPERHTRWRMFGNTPGGLNVGSIEGDQVALHAHLLAGAARFEHFPGHHQLMGAPGDGDLAGNTELTGDGIGNETRPCNTYLHFIIRVR